MKKQKPDRLSAEAWNAINAAQTRRQAEELAQLELLEQAGKDIEYHSHPERMTPAQLFDIDDL